MALRDSLEAIPIINDHTHTFGTGEVDDYEGPGRFVENLTPEKLVASISGLNMNERVTTDALDDPIRRRDVLLRLYTGRRTTYPVRAATAWLSQLCDLDVDEITLANAGVVLERMRQELPVGTDALYECYSRMSNTEVWFCNHGSVPTFERCVPRTTRGRFRWVPYVGNSATALNTTAARLGLDRPASEPAIREVITAALSRVKDLGAVALKGGAFAYALGRPFAPDVGSLALVADAKDRVDLGIGDERDAIVLADAVEVITAQAAGIVGLPVQIHVGLIWSAMGGATRIPEVMELGPLFYACPETTFVVLHGGYPRTDDLAHLTATMTNVRAEFNWVPFWAGMDFPHIIGKWIDMIPNDRVLYGTDASGFVPAVHDKLTRDGLASALEHRVERGYLSKRVALEVAAKILRNNSIVTYELDLPEYCP